MKFRSAIALCAVVVGLSGLTLCQPPRPRIARVEVPPFLTANIAETKGIFTASIHSDVKRSNGCHSRESGNPEQGWIPGQARNDKEGRTYVAMYNQDEWVIQVRDPDGPPIRDVSRHR